MDTDDVAITKSKIGPEQKTEVIKIVKRVIEVEVAKLKSTQVRPEVVLLKATSH